MLALTTQKLNYPHEFRPVPRFSIEVPAEWKVFEFPGALFAVSSVDPDAPWMNIIVAHERIAAGTHEDVLIRRYTELVAKYPDVEVEPEQGVELDNAAFLCRGSVYTDPDLGTPVSRFEASTIAPNAVGLLVNDLFTITFLAPLDANEDELAAVVLETITSFGFV